MDNLSKLKRSFSRVIAAAVLVVCLITTKYLLRPDETRENFMNSDATWHTLLIVKAMQETSAEVHRFLPIVTLGDDNDKFIPWAKTPADQYGNRYYTSFMPLDFIVPYLWFEITGLPLNENGLYMLSALLSAVSFFALAWLILRLFRNKLPGWLLLASAFLIYFFLPEMIHSTAAVYWGQMLLQPVFLLQLLFYQNLREKGRKRDYIIFFALAFLASMVEWTGYVANVGFAAAAFFELLGKKTRVGEVHWIRKKILFISGLALCCVAAIGIFVLRYLAVLDAAEFSRSLLPRVGARNYSISASYGLLNGYWQSYHVFLIILAAMIIAAIALPKARKKLMGALREYRVWIFIAFFPLMENLLLMGHARDYTYDRMKAVIPLVILFIIALYALLPSKQTAKKICVAACVAVLGVLSVYNVTTYLNYGSFGGLTYRWRMDGYEDNIILASYIDQNFEQNDIIIGVQGAAVRGYTNLLFERGVYEFCDTDALVELAQRQGKMYVLIVIVQDNGNQWEKDEYKGIQVINAETGNYTYITPEIASDILAYKAGQNEANQRV